MDDVYVSEEFDDWQLIPFQSSSSIEAHQWTSKFETPVIKDDFFSEFAVFPPVYYEGLSMYSSQASHFQESSSEQPIYPRLSEEEDLDEDEIGDDNNKDGQDGGAENENGKKRGVLVEVWRSRLVQFVSTAKRAKWWVSGFAMTGIVSTVVVSLWWIKVRRQRKRVQMERVEQLMLLIRERDQKINHLLLQIAQMNETLSARRNVPVIRLA